LPKTLEKYESHEKHEFEMLRQWKVVIQDIEITNHSHELISPFVKFTIGGNYYVSMAQPQPALSCSLLAQINSISFFLS